MKTEKSQGLPEGNSSKNKKDGCRGRSQSPTSDNFSPTKKRKHTKKSDRRKRKIRYSSSSSSSAISTTSDNDSSDNEPSNKLNNQDKVLEKIQVKIGDMGSLCELWYIVEKTTNSNEQSANASLDNMQKFIEQRF